MGISHMRTCLPLLAAVVMTFGLVGCSEAGQDSVVAEVAVFSTIESTLPPSSMSTTSIVNLACDPAGSDGLVTIGGSLLPDDVRSFAIETTRSDRAGSVVRTGRSDVVTADSTGARLRWSHGSRRYDDLSIGSGRFFGAFPTWSVDFAIDAEGHYSGIEGLDKVKQQATDFVGVVANGSFPQLVEEFSALLDALPDQQLGLIFATDLVWFHSFDGLPIEVGRQHSSDEAIMFPYSDRFMSAVVSLEMSPAPDADGCLVLTRTIEADTEQVQQLGESTSRPTVEMEQVISAAFGDLLLPERVIARVDPTTGEVRSVSVTSVGPGEGEGEGEGEGRDEGVTIVRTIRRIGS